MIDPPAIPGRPRAGDDGPADFRPTNPQLGARTMPAAGIKNMTEEKAVAVVVRCGFTVSRVPGPNGTHAYRVADTHGAFKIMTPQELRRSAWLWS